MKVVRHTWLVVSLAILAMLVGNFAIQSHFRSATRIVDITDAELHPACDDLRQYPSPRIMTESGKNKMPRFLSDVASGSPVIPALDIQTREPHGQTQRVADPPTAVPTPADAVPVDVPSADETNSQYDNTSAVREVIEHELSHATREEREIWFDELKTLPAGVVQDLLQVRKQLHALPRLLGGMPEKLASADPQIANRTHEIAAEPASQKIRFNGPDQFSSTIALESAVSQLRHNLTNAATPGFKRLRVMVVDNYTSTVAESESTDDSGTTRLRGNSFLGDGCRIAPLLLDLKQGPLKKTARQFDLAIDGDGFFVVRRGEKEFLTRCGALTLDRDRQLCLAMTNDDAVLQPAMKIPFDAREIQIAANGLVMVLKPGDTAPVAIGNLQLAQVPSPARLHPAGSTLFVTSEESGAVVLGSPMAGGLGEIQQGFLEQSNVDFEKEQEEIDELTTILKSLPSQSFRPATANSLHQSPTH